MCAVIGCVSDKEPVLNTLLKGLERMEYRGYDSAGVALSNGKAVEIVKAAGKLDRLKRRVAIMPRPQRTGIGHTRWATHGKPSSTNAHPHRAGKITLVHNGIIENFANLKADLRNAGYKFYSRTDTEVLAALIWREYQTTGKLELATAAALAKVKGTYAIAVLCDDQPQTILAARQGSPMVVGRSKEALLLASDPTALAGLATEVCYLNDGQMALLTTKGIRLLDAEGRRQRARFKPLTLQAEALEKDGFDHFLLKEIYQQPLSVRKLQGLFNDTGNARQCQSISDIKAGQYKHINRLLVFGCGSAYYAGLLAKYWLERYLKLPTDVETASELRYRRPMLRKDTLAVAISQSGETADTLAALTALKEQGLDSVGLVNVAGSSIARAVDKVIPLMAGPEISVASTKAFTNQALAALLLGGIIKPLPRQVVTALRHLPAEIETVLERAQEIKRLAAVIEEYDNALYLGRGELYPIALEGALKLKEISYIHAEGYPAGEMKHGPIALIDKSFLTVMLIGRNRLELKSLSNLEEIRSRGGPTVVITDDPKLAGEEPMALFLPLSSSFNQPLAFNVALQLLAYYVALARARNIDQPRNLAKSVTVE